MKFKNIIFDCDSTLTRIEGLDEIARRKWLLGRVREITTAGMGGGLLFSQSLRLRLEIIKPTVSDLEWLGQRYVDELVEGAESLVEKLRANGVRVFVLTGGLYLAVRLLARHLKIEDSEVCAVDFRSGRIGSFRGFNPFQGLNPITDLELNIFKNKFVQDISQTGPTALIGDGLTDYQAGQHADLFIGFGGVVRREKVKELSSVYLEEPRLQPILDIVL